MNDIGPEAKSLFEAARKAGGLPGPERARIKQAVLLQAATVGAATTLAGGAAAMSMTTKLTLVVLAAAILGGGSVSVWAWQKHKDSAPGTQNRATLAVANPVVVNAHLTEKPGPVPAPALADPQPASPDGAEERPVAQGPAAVEPRTRASARVTFREKPLRAPAPVAQLDGQAHTESARAAANPSWMTGTSASAVTNATGPAPVSLDSELNLLRQAQEDLRLGMPAQALQRLADFDRLFPKAKLDQERQAIEAIASCQVYPGPAAAARAHRFLQRAPLSPLAARVRSACQQNEQSKSFNESSPRREQ